MTLVDPEYERAPCAWCGAVSVDDAETKCRPVRDETGEGKCPAKNEDEAGFFTRPTAASLAALDAAIDVEVKRLGYV